MAAGTVARAWAVTPERNGSASTAPGSSWKA